MGVDISISFILVDEDLMVSPFGDLVDGDQEFSIEHILVSVEIEFELVVQIEDGGSQSSLEINSDGGDFHSDGIVKELEGNSELLSNKIGGFSNSEGSFGLESSDLNIYLSPDVNLDLEKHVPCVFLESSDVAKKPVVPVGNGVIEIEVEVNFEDGKFLFKSKSPVDSGIVDLKVEIANNEGELVVEFSGDSDSFSSEPVASFDFDVSNKDVDVVPDPDFH